MKKHIIVALCCFGSIITIDSVKATRNQNGLQLPQLSPQVQRTVCVSQVYEERSAASARNPVSPTVMHMLKTNKSLQKGNVQSEDNSGTNIYDYNCHNINAQPLHANNSNHSQSFHVNKLFIPANVSRPNMPMHQQQDIHQPPSFHESTENFPTQEMSQVVMPSEHPESNEEYDSMKLISTIALDAARGHISGQINALRQNIDVRLNRKSKHMIYHTRKIDAHSFLKKNADKLLSDMFTPAFRTAVFCKIILDAREHYDIALQETKASKTLKAIQKTASKELYADEIANLSNILLETKQFHEYYASISAHTLWDIFQEIPLEESKDKCIYDIIKSEDSFLLKCIKIRNSIDTFPKYSTKDCQKLSSTIECNHLAFTFYVMWLLLGENQVK